MDMGDLLKMGATMFINSRRHDRFQWGDMPIPTGSLHLPAFVMGSRE